MVGQQKVWVNRKFVVGQQKMAFAGNEEALNFLNRDSDFQKVQYNGSSKLEGCLKFHVFFCFLAIFVKDVPGMGEIERRKQTPLMVRRW